jgi:cohesin complex subunit SA-1/2
VSSPTKKRARDTSESDSEHSEGLEVDDAEKPSSDESTDDGDEFKGPANKNKSATPAAKRRGRPPQNAGTSSAKKPAPAPAKGVIRRRPGRKPAKGAEETTALKDTAISDDNVLFSEQRVYLFAALVYTHDIERVSDALLNPSAALQSTVEDFLDALSNSPEVALADLINCTLRSCGCNASVDSDVVMDSDGIVDFLEELMNDLKKVSIASPTFLCFFIDAISQIL